MADALDLGSCALGRVGSSPTFRTIVMNHDMVLTEPPGDPWGFIFLASIFAWVRSGIHRVFPRFRGV